MLLSKLRWAIMGFVAVLFGGTLGYRYIEHWPWLDSVWMVVITLTTIGFGEPHPLSHEGRIFTIGLVILGVGFGTYTVGRATRYVVDGRLAKDLQARRKKRQMEKLQDHYIVIGFGRLGREVAAELAHRGEQVVAVDPTESVFDGQKFLASQLVGDASSDDTLRQVAIDRAIGLAVATGSDETNIFVTLSARQLNPDLVILTRVNLESSTTKAFRAGATAVINPYGIGGARMAQGLLHPHAAQLVDIAVGRAHVEFEIEDIQIKAHERFNGPIGAMGIPETFKILIVAVKKQTGQLQTVTDRDTTLEPGDVAVVVGRPEDIARFKAEAGSPRPRGRSHIGSTPRG